MKDDVASKDTREAVLEHIAQCEMCHVLFNGELEEKPRMNEQRVFEKLRKQLFMMVMAMISIGSIVYAWHFIKYMEEGLFDKTQWISAIIAPTLWGLISGGLCALGVLIAFLLYIAFKKEKK